MPTLCSTLCQLEILGDHEKSDVAGSGGYSIRVQSIDDAEGSRTIGVHFSCPPPDAITTCAMTQPHHVVRMPKSTLPVMFVEVVPPAPAEQALEMRFLLTLDESKKDKATEEANW